MTPAEWGRHLAAQEPPLTAEEIEVIARTYVAVMAEAEVAA